MKNMILILSASLFAAAPAAAELTADTPGYLYPVSVRYEMVYQIAVKACPLIQKTDEKLVATRFLQIQQSFKLSSNELTILLNQCLSYSQGYNDAP